jgi:dGTPase
MDWADDITYAVHDVEDFYRAGLIPTSRLGRPGDIEMSVLARLTREKWEPKLGSSPTDAELEQASEVAFEFLPRVQPFRGTVDARSAVRQGTSALINRFVLGTKMYRDGLRPDRLIAVEVTLLKQLTRHFVIRNPALATQQIGQKRVIEDLFRILRAEFERGENDAFPTSIRDVISGLEPDKDEERLQGVRLIIDLIAGMTEAQAVKLHRRLTGTDFGALIDPAIT